MIWNDRTAAERVGAAEGLCPNVSRDTIRLLMSRWREQGRLEILGKGRGAKWMHSGAYRGSSRRRLWDLSALSTRPVCQMRKLQRYWQA
jgi:hypothetical protein